MWVWCMSRLGFRGHLASARKGVGSFTLVVRGKSAHAGRAFYEGRNAICALAKVVGPLAELSGKNGNITVNIGTFSGGTVANVVPDLAQAKINVRTENDAQGEWFEAKLAEAVVQLNALDGIEAFSHGYFNLTTKPLTSPTQALLDLIADTAKSLGQSITWQATGGACDGNKLAKEGLPTVDSLGVVGADIHSDRERVLVDSLVERAKLSAIAIGSICPRCALGGEEMKAAIEDGFSLRPVRESDLPALYQLAKESGAGFTTLPEDEEFLAQKIQLSIESFSAEFPRRGRRKLLVYVD